MSDLVRKFVAFFGWFESGGPENPIAPLKGVEEQQILLADDYGQLRGSIIAVRHESKFDFFEVLVAFEDVGNGCLANGWLEEAICLWRVGLQNRHFEYRGATLDNLLECERWGERGCPCGKSKRGESKQDMEKVAFHCRERVATPNDPKLSDRGARRGG